MGGVWHTTKWTKRTCVGALRSKRGRVHREGCGVPQNGTPRDTIHLHRRPPPASTGPLFIHRQPTPASTGSCSSSLHRALLHQLLFNHPSPRAPVQPPLHGHPSIVYCSSSPPHHGVLFIQRQRHRSLFIQPHPPPQHSLFIQRQHRSASVSSSSERIARSGSVNSHRSIARVQ